LPPRIQNRTLPQLVGRIKGSRLSPSRLNDSGFVDRTLATKILANRPQVLETLGL
jgi:hypothetical protein